MLKLIGYLRVSSAGQVEAWGLDRQEAAIRRWAKANYGRIVKWCRDEGVSGTVEAVERPGLAEAIELMAPLKADGIIAADMDRYARKLMVQEAAFGVIWQRGGRAFTATGGEVLQDQDDDAARTLIRQVLGAVAQYEKTQAVMRMRHGRLAKQRAGRKSTGSYAFGFHGEGKGRERDAAPNPAEQAARDEIVRRRKAKESFREIAAALDAAGLKPRRADRWSAMAVRSVARRAGLS
ncbi:recombinase family protein [Micromonospora sp. NPDC007208]|uniref:recombinase family protein n=1 Tax=Micromonospora sp. NPDC007208 TaxID=3364236 RepID=UPI0036AE7BC7